MLLGVPDKTLGLLLGLKVPGLLLRVDQSFTQ